MFGLIENQEIIKSKHLDCIFFAFFRDFSRLISFPNQTQAFER